MTIRTTTILTDWSWFYPYWSHSTIFSSLSLICKNLLLFQALRNPSFFKSRSTNTSIRKFTFLSLFKNYLQLIIFSQWSKASQNLKAHNIWPNYHSKLPTRWSHVEFYSEICHLSCLCLEHKQITGRSKVWGISIKYLLNTTVLEASCLANYHTWISFALQAPSSLININIISINERWCWTESLLDPFFTHVFCSLGSGGSLWELV